MIVLGFALVAFTFYYAWIQVTPDFDVMAMARYELLTKICAALAVISFTVGVIGVAASVRQANRADRQKSPTETQRPKIGD